MRTPTKVVFFSKSESNYKRESITFSFFFTFRQEKLSVRNDTYHELVKNTEIDNCLSGNGTNEINNEKLACFKTRSSYHVPDYCTVPVGSIIYHHPYCETRKVVDKSVIKGLAIQSKDCTFTLATDIPKHYEWINSVVFGSEID